MKIHFNIQSAISGNDFSIITPCIIFDKEKWASETEYSLGLILFCWVFSVRLTINKKHTGRKLWTGSRDYLRKRKKNPQGLMAGPQLHQAILMLSAQWIPWTLWTWYLWTNIQQIIQLLIIARMIATTILVAIHRQIQTLMIVGQVLLTQDQAHLMEEVVFNETFHTTRWRSIINVSFNLLLSACLVSWERVVLEGGYKLCCGIDLVCFVPVIVFS